MTIDPMASYLKMVESVEKRVQAVRAELIALRGAAEAVNAETEISASLEDIEAGWGETKRFADIIAETSPYLAGEILRSSLRLLDGWFDAGRLLSRSEVVSRRFGPKAHAAARAAKMRKRNPIQQREAVIIADELANLPTRPPSISPYTAADQIESAVNARLEDTVVDGRRLKPLSVTTIARRIISFSL